MARIPIEIEKTKIAGINSKERVEYLVTIQEKNEKWLKTIKCDKKDLIRFRDEIDQIILKTTIAETLNISEDQGELLEQVYKTDKLCYNCKNKLTRECVTCIFTLQSPLERKLFLALNDKYIKFHTQYALNWNGKLISIEGKTYHDPRNNFKEVLTVIDFFIDKGQTKLAVYTDGHTYHERTEEQAKRDRRIDRKLQEFGYTVLRFTGKEVNENIDKVISDIKNWLK